jgi:hypothetical protein
VDLTLKILFIKDLEIMKKILLVSVLIVFLFGCKSKDYFITDKKNNNVDSTRTNTYEVEYDFKKGIYVRNNLRLLVNTPTVFKVSNINKLAYNISIGSNDVILAETALTDNLKEELKEAISTKNTVIVADKKGVVTAQKLDLSNIDKKYDFKDNKKDGFEEFSKSIKSTEKVTKLIAEKEKLNVQVKDLILNFKILEINIADEKKDSSSVVLPILEKSQKVKKDSIVIIEDALKKITNDIATEINSQKESILKKFNEDNVAFQAAFYTFNEVYKTVLKLQECYSDVKVIADYPYMTEERFQKDYKSECHRKADVLFLQKESLTQFKEYYRQVGIKYSNLRYNPYLSDFLNYGGISKLYAQADYIKQLADEMNNDVNSINISLVLNKLEHLLKYLEDEKTYEYTSAPIQPIQDAANFEIKIEKRLDNNAVITNEKTFSHTEFTYGGTRVDFSAGLAASYFGNATAYEFGIDGKGATILSEKNDNIVAPALVGLVTMSYRQAGSLAVGASAGLGIDATNGKVQLSNFFIGPTLLFGKSDRLFVTAGLSFRNVQQLKSGYTIGEVITGGADDIDKYLSDKYAVGSFISLTYNLTKGVRASIKQLK